MIIKDVAISSTADVYASLIMYSLHLGNQCAQHISLDYQFTIDTFHLILNITTVVNQLLSIIKYNSIYTLKSYILKH